MKYTKPIVLFLSLVVAGWVLVLVGKQYLGSQPSLIGKKIDSLHGVYVYYNGSIDHVSGRSVTADGYNLGLRYQCVEFVKRYYYQALHHQMPDSYGHACDFFDASLMDGQQNSRRALMQFSNPSTCKPQVGDIIVFNKTTSNPYGHVAIVSAINDNVLELIQQNAGPRGKSRVRLPLVCQRGQWFLKQDHVLGWLRKSE
ncbi:MAG: CHAP domain-containing protein [Ferruginibacter sp.]